MNDPNKITRAQFREMIEAGIARSDRETRHIGAEPLSDDERTRLRNVGERASVSCFGSYSGGCPLTLAGLADPIHERFRLRFLKFAEGYDDAAPTWLQSIEPFKIEEDE